MAVRHANVFVESKVFGAASFRVRQGSWHDEKDEHALFWEWP
jgi:hypothetical protein